MSTPWRCRLFGHRYESYTLLDRSWGKIEGDRCGRCGLYPRWDKTIRRVAIAIEDDELRTEFLRDPSGFPEFMKKYNAARTDWPAPN